MASLICIAVTNFNIVLIAVLLNFIGMRSMLCEMPEYTYKSKEMTVLFEEGKAQFNLLKEKSIVPHYGLCWKRAVNHLEKNCRQLDENIQSVMALKFMDCFLQMSGYKPYECDTALEKDVCMKDMSDRAFNVYTEFYTHTQAICFFLQNQIWHEETERTIDRLSTSSAHVAEQLEQAEQLQTTLLEQQEKSMSVQLELLNNGLSLNKLLHNSQGTLHALMEEFRLSTLEQKKMLFGVFDHLSSIQNWILGEISWLDTVLFYIASIIISYIVTATHRAQDARLWIFILLSANAVLERIIATVLLQNDMEDIEAVNRKLDSYIWFCRKITISCCAFAIGMSVYLYCDYNIVNHHLLLQIQKQNLEVLSGLQKLALSQNSFHTTNIDTLDQSTCDRTKLHQTSVTFPAHIKVLVEENNVNSPSPVPSVSSVNSDKSILGLQSEKRKRSRRILEIQATPHQYNLRRSATPSSVRSEKV